MDKILIIEDDEKLRNELKIFLEKNGYEVLIIDNFENLLKDILNIKSDLILLDINLPYLDGIYICKEIRKTSDIPIIMVTCRDNEIDELISLNYGADNYVTKPYNIQILLAKISRLLKRNKKDTNLNDIIKHDKFIFDISKSLIKNDKKSVDLTKNESKILLFLLKNKGKIISRNDIIDNLWENESFVDDNTLTVNMTRLRNKLEEIEVYDCIETKRGQRYLLN